jgi:hypothetical protein
MNAVYSVHNVDPMGLWTEDTQYACINYENNVSKIETIALSYPTCVTACPTLDYVAKYAKILKICNCSL